MKLGLINASNPVNTKIEWDEYVDYRDGGYEACFNKDGPIKKVRSWHSIPALFSGEFCVYNKKHWQNIFKYDVVLVLVNRDLNDVAPLIKKLKLLKKKVLVGFHENFDDFQLQCMDLNWLPRLQALVSEADGYLNVIPQAESFFLEVFKEKNVINTLHPAPFGIWDTSNLVTPFEKREGIMVVTRTLNQRLRRNTIFALFVANKVAKSSETFVTYLTEDPIEEGYFKSIGLDRIKVLRGPLDYKDWLKLLGRHKLLCHFDKSGTLGQVVTDAALVGNMVFGGNTDNNIQSFSDCASIEDFSEELEGWIGSFELEEEITSHISQIKRKTNPEAVKRNLIDQIGEIK